MSATWHSGRFRTVLALAFQVAAVVVLSAALLGVPWLDARSKPRLLLMIDRSQSMPREAGDAAVANVVRTAESAGVDVRVLEFAGGPGVLSRLGGTPLADLQPAATNIEAALDVALAAHAETAFMSAVVISDGLENAGDAARALHAAHEARLPIRWIAVGRPAPETRIAQVIAPDRAFAGQRMQLGVQLTGRLGTPVRITATARTAGGEVQRVRGEPDATGRVTIELDAARDGAMLIDVALDDPSSGQLLEAWPDAAVVDVTARAAILYARGSDAALSRSLRAGGWSLDLVPAARLDGRADALDGYQAVVLDDVSVSDASPRFWNALVAAVRDRGLGLMVLGGERSFVRGGYHDSVLESVLPVLSEPAALDEPVSIMFAVDKSGSMGEGSAGVNRFQLAQRAVLETARALTERDSLGLVVFDVAPRVLIPLGGAGAGTAVLARDWPVTPSGGTKLAPALEVAIAELEHAGAARRMLVIVTDGFVDDAPLAELRARLDRSRIEVIALAVGPDADVTALQNLVGMEHGVVLRVGEAAELPAVMRSGIERRRARVERGTIETEQRQSLPFAPGVFVDWPAVTAYAVTRSRPGATVAVQSQRGDPLIAFHDVGQGRVLVVPSGLDAWAAPWLQWREWPRLAGGLADWISGVPAGGALALSVADLPDGLQLDADLHVGSVWGDGRGTSVSVATPKTVSQPLALEHVAAGRLRATVPDAGPGLYTFVVSSPYGTRRLLHLRHARVETATWGTNPALAAWRSKGLISDWDAASLSRRSEDARSGHPPDRSLVALALVLFVAGILADRAMLHRRFVHVFRRRAASNPGSAIADLTS